MNKLLNLSLKRYLVYSTLVLILSIPVYYLAISILWQFELRESRVILTPEAGREDTLIILGAVTLLTAVFFVLLLGGILLINRNISRKLWTPFYKSLDKIKAFSLDEYDQIDFDQTNIVEFSELNKSLGKLLSGNISAYRQQKEFADNASHELQTPLAIAQSKLEIILQSQSLTRQQYAQIEEALRALTRVKRINKNLLLLAKIENSQYKETELLSVSVLLQNCLQLFSDFLETKSLSTHIKADEVLVHGNKILIEILLQNLLSNAIRYSPAGTVIPIILDANKLEISNCGTTSLDAKRLFKRFSAVSSENPGTGLGLAIAQQICRQYSWTIEYRFVDGQHIFSVIF